MTSPALQAKICGLSTPDGVEAAVAGGAAFLGFVFFEKSPRNVSVEQAARLAEPVRGRSPTRIVAVTVDATDDELDRICRGLNPDLIQLHGREPPERAHEVQARTGAAVIKAIPVSGSGDIEAARSYESAVSHLLFDARPPPGAALPGGVGARFDWTLLKGLHFSRPWFLAGGLDPWNVSEAAALSGARLADVSSGVERGPGLKDPALITAFMNAVRRT